jgi:hypothetical protein
LGLGTCALLLGIVLFVAPFAWATGLMSLGLGAAFYFANSALQKRRTKLATTQKQ